QASGGNPSLFRSAGLEFLQPAAFLEQTEERVGQSDVALVLDLRHGEVAVRVPRIAGDEGEFSFTGETRRPSERLLGPRRMAVSIDLQERCVEVVARKHEIIEVAPKVRGLQLGGEHDSYVLKTLLLVQAVSPAFVEGDHVAANLVAGAAFLLDLRHRRPLS